VPEITGQVIILTVSNADRSAAWYGSVLGWKEGDRYVQPDGHVHRCRTRTVFHPASGSLSRKITKSGPELQVPGCSSS
jgi:catechol 2,3-dioxygenase-like lactoylglutathione lyase family enzyme